MSYTAAIYNPDAPSISLRCIREEHQFCEHIVTTYAVEGEKEIPIDTYVCGCLCHKEEP
jgi:hypothetical protein